jgi:hypothetical protein
VRAHRHHHSLDSAYGPRANVALAAANVHVAQRPACRQLQILVSGVLAHCRHYIFQSTRVLGPGFHLSLHWRWSG